MRKTHRRHRQRPNVRLLPPTGGSPKPLGSTRPKRTLRWLATPLLLFMAISCADSQRLDLGPDPVAACDAYVGVLERCLSAAVGTGAVAERVAATRENLESAVRGASTAAARETLKARCEAGSKQLQASCR
jgi:hypothetical protein